MFDIAILDEPTELPFHYENRKRSRLNKVCKPEERLRKLLAQIDRIELFALILVLTIAVVGVVSCFTELFQLLDNDAIGWIARKAAGSVSADLVDSISSRWLIKVLGFSSLADFSPGSIC